MSSLHGDRVELGFRCHEEGPRTYAVSFAFWTRSGLGMVVDTQSLRSSPAVGEEPGTAFRAIRRLGHDRRDEALALWRNVEARQTSVALTCSFNWTAAWLEAYGEMIPHEFVVAEVLDQPVGIALVTEGVGQTEGPLPIRTRHLGTAGEPEASSVVVEYNDILVEPQHRDWFLREIIGVMQSSGEVDAIRLDGFPAGIIDIANGKGWHTRPVVSRYYDLVGSDEPWALLSPNMRRSIRRKLRGLEPCELVWSTSREEALASFNHLVELHQARWTKDGEPGCYSDPRFFAFHRNVAERLAPAGQAVFACLKHKGEVLAAAELLIDRGRLLQYQKGWNPEHEKLSPGLVLDCLCLEEARLRGYRHFDFLGGISDYKTRLSSHENSLEWREYRLPTWKWMLLDNARRARQVFRSLIPSARTNSETETEADLPTSSPESTP
ncbi:MAG: GNAT family N-acetyltransferase [Planctomycetaceae bacterium]|nr:GNAT family N-acetyltransferase [Planctomycetaceae bacterium]